MNSRGKTTFALCLMLCLSACGAPARQGSVKADNNTSSERLTQFQQRVQKASADDFGQFIVEVHKTGSNLVQAEQSGANVDAGEKALAQALTHREKAEDAFLRLISVLEDTSNMQDLSERLAYLESIHVAEGEEIDPVNIYFSFSSSQMNRAEEDKITKLVSDMQEYPVFALKLVSYADTVGSKDRNLRLAEARNYSVLRALHGEGLPINTLVSVAVGEVGGPDEVRNPQNRRVEIIPYVHGRDPKIAEAIALKEDAEWAKETAKMNLGTDDDSVSADGETADDDENNAAALPPESE